MIYFGIYCWKYVYDPLWYTIKVESYIDSNILVFAQATIVREHRIDISLDASIA